MPAPGLGDPSQAAVPSRMDTGARGNKVDREAELRRLREQQAQALRRAGTLAQWLLSAPY